MKFLLPCILLSIALPCHSFEMGISASRTPPIATIYHTKDGPKIRQTGVLYLLGQYIARHTKEPTTYTVLERNQMDAALADNSVMSVCYTTPEWVDLPKGSVVFTKPFMTNNESLVSKKPIPLIKTVANLHQLTIGLIKGHHYPIFEKSIEKGLINVEYYHSETNAFISLFRQSDLDAIVFKEVGFRQLMKSMPQIVGNNNVTIHPLSFGELQVSCALSIDHQHYLGTINRAIDEYISDQSL